MARAKPTTSTKGALPVTMYAVQDYGERSNVLEVIPISVEMSERARHRAEAMGSLPNSVIKGQGNLTGFLGEEIVMESAKKRRNVKLLDDYNGDLLINGRIIEVKSQVQRVERMPAPNYLVNVLSESVHQTPEFYIFTRILERTDYYYPHGWICGTISATEFFGKAVLRKKGHRNEDNGFTTHTDCYMLPIKELHPCPWWSTN